MWGQWERGRPGNSRGAGDSGRGKPEIGDQRPRGGPGPDQEGWGPRESRAQKAGTLTLGPLSTAEGLSKGGLPGPIGEAFLEEEDATWPSLQGTGSADGLGPLAGALCEPLKDLGHQGGDGCWWQGLGFYRAGGRTGLEVALVRGVGVVTRSHGQRWERPVLGINVVMNTALRFSSAQPGGPTQ